MSLLSLDELGHKLAGRSIEEVLDRALLFDLAIAQQDNLIGKIGRFVQVMRHHHDSFSQRLEYLLQLDLQLAPNHRIERTQRFVHQQDRRFENQRPHQANPLTLSTG